MADIRVLLANHHPMVREGLRAVLERHDDLAVVAETGTGQEVIDALRRTPADVVVVNVDGDLPGAVDTARGVQANLPDVRVLAISGGAEQRDVLRVLEAGANGFVLKSSGAEVVLAIRAVHHEGAYLSPEVADMVVARGRDPKGGADDLANTSPLQPRERDVLSLLADGLSSKQIAARLGIATRTVETHRRNIMRKLGLHSIAALTKYAIRIGLSRLES